MKKFDFDGLFIYDMANNHQGDLQHGLNIVRALGDVTREEGVRGALKFQFRYLDTFIHPDYKARADVAHIPRFMSTALSREAFATLTEEVRKQSMVTISTPFDEESVDLIHQLGIEIIKVASCSNKDKPLLECIADTKKPVIVSLAGLSLNEIDRLVSFLEHKDVHFALMHCVAIYPTPLNRLNLNQIEMLRNRFPDVPIGFSTHENPEVFSIIRAAYAKGARVFERHVGLETESYKLNSYSSTPQQIAQWIRAYQETVDACGGEHRSPSHPDEISSLDSLRRGVYAKKSIKKGDEVKRDDVFFAMPLLEKQLSSGQWVIGISSDKDYENNEPLNSSLAKLELSKDELIYRIMLQVMGMLRNTRIFIGKNSSIEISHHYGLERFREFGAVIIDCINRSYCKKLIVQLPRQKHPYHYHKKKEETFQLLFGDLEVELEGKRYKLELGDTFLVKPNQWHKFHTLDGAIFEEVSTTHYNDDSFYEDEKIASLPRESRKTIIPNWEASVKDSL